MKPTHVFQAEDLVAGYENKTVIHGVDLAIPSNQISVIIGANGCGKSTLLKTLARLIKPISGKITLDGKPISKIPPKQLARVVGLLPQSPIVPEGISVADLVGRGRFPHQSLLSGWTKKDYAAVAEAMEIMDITEFANHNIDELSGGQRQRVWIAMALAQETDILFLDEPTTFLDITYQVEILDLLTDLNRKHGTTIVMVLHDINLSARYADHIIALVEGKLVAEGAPSDVITSTMVKDIFGLDCTVVEDPLSGSPLVVPRGRYHVHAGE
ncbi:ABC transporter ATP-binding protein [Paenibacillus illinoisensis]|jgi:iron complex transport system ATP-binding protein|uniref:Iron ABC transporter ATP-binding protein n=1 Tax=Paenibacillus illinoisensis TaxID=59845 RepID=A0A2W0CEA9_9BACL|nr:ABC transporter ATP-binding protein [Paenibacillus illinoisensis]PYY29099.1 Iron ABC transporter ATP-binding protein [Paenibacillus illinoisensis]